MDTKQIAQKVEANGTVKVEKENGIPTTRGYWNDSKQGVYFRVNQNTPLTPIQKSTIEKAFPLTIGDETYILDNITDLEKDDDRIWRASFAIIKK